MKDSNPQDSKGEATEEKPEPVRYPIIDPTPESPNGAPAKTGPQDSEGEKTAEKPEPIRYPIVEPAPESPKGASAKTGPQGSKGEKAKGKPESPKGTSAKIGSADPKSEKTEEKPEPLRYAIVEPPPEPPQSTPAKDDQQDSDGEKTEEKQELPRYSIIEPPPEPPSDFANFDLRLPPVTVVATNEQKNIRDRATHGQPPFETSPGGTRKFSQNPTNVYIAAGIGLGLFFGIIIAIVSWRMASPVGPSDLGSVTSAGTGLKGHLYTKWDKKLEYHLTFEPGDPGQHAGFAFAIVHPPRPLSIEIHLQDAQGFVLCSRDIVLKYDPNDAPAPAASNPDPDAGKAVAVDGAGDRPAKGLEDLLAAQEAERELGKEVFQNEIGPDGQPAAIYAQGEIPCSQKAFASTASWSFTPDFPSLAEQNEALKPKEEAAASGGRPSPSAPAARRKVASVPAPKLLPFSIEGDDEIVDFDAFRGIIQTRNGKTFFFDRTNGDISDTRWMDYPVGIHYKCDQTSTCTLTHAGIGALRARLKR